MSKTLKALAKSKVKIKKRLSKIQVLNEIVEDLLKNYEWLTFEETDEVYVCEGGIWQNHRGKTIVEETVNLALGKQTRQKDRNEVYYGIRSRTRKPYGIIEANFNPNLISVVDGVYNLENGRLEDCKPEHYMFYVVPVRFAEGAECPNIDKFFREIVRKKGDSEEIVEQKVETLYQIAGYCLYRAMPIHKFIILVGEGNNGKSTYLKLLESFLGKKNITRESLQNLAYNRFATVRLFGKLANIHADIPAKPIRYTGQIKMLTGNDPISGEKKFVQNTLPFTNTTKLIFSCNILPEADDDTLAWYRRQQIIEFPNVFSDELGNCDKNILDKLTTKEELSGFFNKAIKGLRKLLKEGNFAFKKTDEEWGREYVNRSNAIKAFAMNMLEDEPNTRVPKRTVYQSYKDYCDKQKLFPKDPRIFWLKMKKYIPIIESRIREGKKRIYCIDGIKIIDSNYAHENRQIENVQTTLPISKSEVNNHV